MDEIISNEGRDVAVADGSLSIVVLRVLELCELTEPSDTEVRSVLVALSDLLVEISDHVVVGRLLELVELESITKDVGERLGETFNASAEAGVAVRGVRVVVLVVRVLVDVAVVEH